MIDHNDLNEYLDTFNKLLKKFIKSDSFGMYLNTKDDALFKQKIMEVTSLLDDMFGKSNRYTGNIIHTANELSVGFLGGPSYAAVQNIIGFIAAAQKEITRKKNVSTKSESTSQDPYVSVERVQQLKSLSSVNYDLSRLIQLCNELNVAHKQNSYMSIAMLLRAIIDHIPPIFGFKNFTEIVNNYTGPKSFKEAMKHLDSSLRKIADSHLHVQIRRKEVLPEFQQVDFRAPLDLLLAEIISLLSDRI